LKPFYNHIMPNYRRVYGTNAYYFTVVTNGRGIGRGRVFTGTCARDIMMRIGDGRVNGGARRGWESEEGIVGSWVGERCVQKPNAPLYIREEVKFGNWNKIWQTVHPKVKESR